MKIETLPGGLRLLAPAKLNLYLEVGGKRPDGFHEIDGLFQSVSLFDELEFHLRKDGSITLEEDGVREGESNLVYRAAALLRETFLDSASPLGVHMRLRKRIPVGAGLGGGSSDAAAALVALSRLWKLGLSVGDLKTLGARLGSDVPFFFHGGTARCRGRGENVTDYNEAFDAAGPFHYVLVYPGVHVSTRNVYEALDRARGTEFALTAPSPLDSIGPALILKQLACGKLFFNRLENVTRQLFPELREVVSLMKEEPFLNVLMSGSGSTFFGLCRDEEEASRSVGCLRKRLASLAVPPSRGLGAGGGSGSAGSYAAAGVYQVRSQPGCRFSGPV